jgi:hypothetical protein
MPTIFSAGTGGSTAATTVATAFDKFYPTIPGIYIPFVHIKLWHLTGTDTGQGEIQIEFTCSSPSVTHYTAATTVVASNAGGIMNYRAAITPITVDAGAYVQIKVLNYSTNTYEIGEASLSMMWMGY